MTMQQAINTLIKYGKDHGFDTPVYSYTGDLEDEISGFRHRYSETVEHLDTGEEMPLYPERILIKN